MELPNDVVMEIVSRLPLTDLVKARALSKYHSQACHESFYKDLAAKHGPLFLDGFVFQVLEDGYNFCFASPYPNSFDFSLDFVPGNNRKIKATAANGLVLVETSHPRSCRDTMFFICKPSTKQCKGIPIPKLRYLTKSMAFYVVGSHPLHFKILRLSQEELSSKRPYSFSYTICELFDSNIWRWKRLNDLVRDCMFGNLVSFSGPVIACGYAHWKNSDERSIFAFDFHSETWSMISMPITIVEEKEDLEKSYENPRWQTELVAYKGMLGLMRKFYEPKTSSMELWIMNNYFNRTWTKRNGFPEETRGFFGSDVSVSSMFYEVTFCNIETNRCHSIELRETNYRYDEGTWMDMFSFMTDFESWDFHPPPRTINPITMAKIIRKNSQKINLL